jgi:hypothetical protein
MHKPDILVLTETWLRTSGKFQLFNIKGYKQFSINRGHNKRGDCVAVYLNDNLISKLINSFITEDMEVIHIKVQLGSTNFLHVISIYRPPNGNINSFINYVESLFNEYEDHLMIIGDINLNLKSTSSYTYSAAYDDLIKSFNYENTINAYTHLLTDSSSQKKGSLIDHILMHQNKLNYALSSTRTDLSDHNLIMGSSIWNVKGSSILKIFKNEIIRNNFGRSVADFCDYFNNCDLNGLDLNQKCERIIGDLSNIYENNHSQNKRC